MHAPRKHVWPDRFRRSGYLIGAILLHAIALAPVARLVVWKAPAPSAEGFQKIFLRVVKPPPVPLRPSDALAGESTLVPPPVDVPVVAPLRSISAGSGAFKIDAVQLLNQSLSQVRLPEAQNSSPPSGAGGSGTGGGFETGNDPSAQFAGTFYDLNQTADKKPTGMQERVYLDLLAEYVRRDWDDSMLAPYYKSSSPLYTEGFAISTRPAAAAPKTFALENEVRPGRWLIHYQAKVEAPTAGDYRLAGFGDSVLLVRIGGTTVLDGGWNSMTASANLREPLPFAFPSHLHAADADHNPNLKIGPAFHLAADESIDMDVLIGDCGELCSFYLLIEKVGSTYETLPDGMPQLPFFQLGNGPSPVFSSEEEHPPFSPTAEPWQVPEANPEK